MKTTLLTITGLILFMGSVSAQCSFTGLPSTICQYDPAATLVGSGPGLFSGPGVVGNTFDPAIAGPGMHQIDYNESDPTTYTVSQAGTFAPYATTGTSVILSDDQVSGMLPIGFTFNFFGTTYTNFYISSNGFITFTSSFNSGCCSGLTVPMADGIDNIIAWGWNDLYPPGGGSITYETVGTAPNRMLLVTFTNQWHCCSGPAVNTGQIVLFESTNIIEIHCAVITSDGSTNTQGIENFDGSIGFTTPGRNSTTWTTTNDYVAFIPQVCTTSQLVEVLPSPTVVGTATPNPACVGSSVTFTGAGANSYAWDQGVVNGSPVTVTASGTYIVAGTSASNGCSNWDTVNLIVNPNPTISLSSNDELFGNDGSINLTILSGVAPFTFDWSNDGTGDNDDSNDLFGVASGTYTVTMTDGNGCTTTGSATIGSQLGLEELSDMQLSIHPNPSSGEFNIVIQNTVDFSSIQLLIVDPLGRRVLEGPITETNTPVNLKGEKAGVYFVKIITERGTKTLSINIL